MWFSVEPVGCGGDGCTIVGCTTDGCTTIGAICEVVCSVGHHPVHCGAVHFVRGGLAVRFDVEVCEQYEEDDGIGEDPVTEEHGVATLDKQQLARVDRHQHKLRLKRITADCSTLNVYRFTVRLFFFRIDGLYPNSVLYLYMSKSILC